MLSHSEYSNSAETYSSTIMISSSSSRKKSKNKKRKFSEDQIKSLESMFESEWRLEPRKKVEVARELGLQPRQVAIWFQNKRARFKSKQLQRDYTLLQADFNAFASKFEALKNENHALLLQLQKLNEQLRSPRDQILCEAEVKQSPSMEDRSMKAEEYFGLEDEHSIPTLMNLVDQHNNTDWGKLETDDGDALLGHPGSTAYQWWDFWS